MTEHGSTTRPEPAIPADAGPTLLALARARIAQEFGIPAMADESAPWLTPDGACFVTLTQHGNLRGCVGSLAAWRPLVADLRANSFAAAFSDPRFPPLTGPELDRTRLEVSVLSEPEPLPAASEADALARLRPNVDGVVLCCRGRQGTFLPQVWDQLPDPGDFLAHLKVKAGLPPGFWADDVTLARYTVTAWPEPE